VPTSWRRHCTNVMQPFVKLGEDAVMTEVHQALCSDLDLQTLALEFEDLLDDANNITDLSARKLYRN